MSQRMTTMDSKFKIISGVLSKRMKAPLKMVKDRKTTVPETKQSPVDKKLNELRRRRNKTCS